MNDYSGITCAADCSAVCKHGVSGENDCYDCETGAQRHDKDARRLPQNASVIIPGDEPGYGPRECSEIITEACECCGGTGLCEDIDGEKGSCMTCNGRGKFSYVPNVPLTGGQPPKGGSPC